MGDDRCNCTRAEGWREAWRCAANGRSQLLITCAPVERAQPAMAMRRSSSKWSIFARAIGEKGQVYVARGLVPSCSAR